MWLHKKKNFGDHKFCNLRKSSLHINFNKTCLFVIKKKQLIKHVLLLSYDKDLLFFVHKFRIHTNNLILLYKLEFSLP